METNEFIKVREVIPIHIERYNSQISRLLAIQDYDRSDLQKGIVSRKDYYRAREERIRAYSDCINTIAQKEKILQYHNSGFQLEVIDEKIEIKKARTPYDISKLAFEEQLELYHLMKKAKKQQHYLAPIIFNVNRSEVRDVERKSIVNDRVNIDLIKREEPPVINDYSSSMKSIDPTIKLRESLRKLAAKRFEEAGGTLDEEEQILIHKF